jgi:hypothetical protein
MAITALTLVVACAISAGCAFKRQPFKGVTGYHDGKVYLTPNRYYAEGVYYNVGELPDDWKRLATRARTISFYNDAYLSSISTDAWCGRNIKDRTLDSLTGDMVTVLEERTFSDEKKLTLDGRGAIRQRITGEAEGVPTVIDLVTVRKGDCVFDFYLVSRGDAPVEATEDFESFFGAFHYEVP